MALADEVLADEPWAYYKLDEASGTTAIDSSGNSRHMTLSASLDSYRNTPRAPGLSLAGGWYGQYGTFPVGLADSDLTFEVWWQPTAFRTLNDLLGVGSETRVFRSGDSDINAGRFQAKIGGTTVQTAPDGVLSLGSPFQIVLRYTAATGEVRVYINGVPFWTTTQGANGFTGSPVRFLYNGSFSNRQARGIGSDLAVWRTALSDERIRAHYAAGAIGSSEGVQKIGTTFPAELQDGSSVSADIPPNVQPGDLMLAQVFTRAAIASAPAGWEVVDERSFDASGYTQYQTIYSRVVDGSETPSVTWTFSTSSGRYAAGVVAYRNARIAAVTGGADPTEVASLTAAPVAVPAVENGALVQFVNSNFAETTDQTSSKAPWYFSDGTYRAFAVWGSSTNSPPNYSRRMAAYELGLPSQPADMVTPPAMVAGRTSPMGLTSVYLAPALGAALAPAVETDTASALTAVVDSIHPVGRSIETNSAAPASVILPTVIGLERAMEIETARAIALPSAVTVPLGQAAETSTATAVSRAHIVYGATQLLDFDALGGSLAGRTQLAVVIHDPIQEAAPTTIQVSVVGLEPDATLAFSVDGQLIWEDVADPDGLFEGTSIPIPEDLAAGTYLLHVSSVANGVGTAEFQLQVDPDMFPAATPGDLEPVPVSGWAFQDVLPGGLGTWVLPIGPSQMTPPHAERPTQVAHTTDPVAGQFVVSEGYFSGHPWRLEGYCPDKAFYDQLNAYAKINRRFWVHDHRGRVWKVGVVGATVEPRKREVRTDGTLNDWAGDWTLDLVIYGQQEST